MTVSVPGLPDKIGDGASRKFPSLRWRIGKASRTQGAQSA